MPVHMISLLFLLSERYTNTGAVPSLRGGHVRSWLVSLYGPSYLAVTWSLFGSTVDTCYVSVQRLLWEIAENVPFSAQCLVRHWILEMFSWSFPYSAQCLVRQWLREMTSWKCSVFSAMLGSTVALGDDFLELSVFSAMLGSTVALGDDFLELFVFSAMLGSTVAPGDDFVEMVVFSALLGSSLDTWCCQSSWPFHRCSSWTRLFCLDPEVHHNGGAAVAVPLPGRQHPCRCAETASHGLTFQRPLRFSCSSTLTKWLMLVVQVRQVPWCSLRGDSRDPTVAASMLDTVVHTSVVVQRQVPLLVETVQNLWEFRSWHCLLDRLTCPLACSFLGPCTQVHGQGCPPPLGRGRGGGDTGSLLPGLLPPN